MKKIAFILTVALIVVPCFANTQKVLTRAGLAIKITSVTDEVNIVFTPILLGSTDVPMSQTSQGCGYRTYSVPLNGSPTRIGWTGDPKTHYPEIAILDNKRYIYTKAVDDRTDNGSISVSPLDKKTGKYRVQGVYSHFGSLFIISATLSINQELLLYEPPSKP